MAIKNRLSPIAIFAYNRSSHFTRTWEALFENPETLNSKIYVFIDGPKSKYDIEEQKKISRLLDNFKTKHTNLKIIFSKNNKGLSTSIIEGVNFVLSKSSRVIVLEDDILVSINFLNYMNEALHTYEKFSSVASVHGYFYPTGKSNPETFFLKGADCWGWGTWDRAWKNFEADGAKLRNELEIRGLMNAFNLYGASPFKKMLTDQIDGKNNSWAIRWHASTYLKNMYTLYPGKSLVNNIGMDGTGVHSGSTKTLDIDLTLVPIKVEKIPIKEDRKMKKILILFFLRQKFALVIEKFFGFLKENIR